LPQYDAVRLGLSLFFRYTLNAILSLGIIWLFFKDKGILKLSSLLYAGFFIILITAFYIVLSANEPNMLVLFYIRRFIIQPLFLILFIPAFYYQNKAK
jgi:exosortase F-associated protein